MPTSGGAGRGSFICLDCLHREAALSAAFPVQRVWAAVAESLVTEALLHMSPVCSS